MRHITKIVLTITLLTGIATAYAQVDERKNALAFSEGLSCKYKNDTEGAIKKFSEALRYMPDDAASMFELSEQYANAGRFEDGLEMVKKATQTDPDNKWYMLRLARYYEIMSMNNEMVATYEKLLDKEPQNIELLGELIEALEESQEYNKALSYLDKAEKVMGPNEIITDERIKIYTQQGKTKKVMAELEKTVMEQPENSKYALTLAKLYMDNGKEKEAVRLYESVKNTDPDDKYASVALLEYYDKKGKTQQAFNELLAAIKNKNLDINTKTSVYDYWFHKVEENEASAQQSLECGKAFIETYPDLRHGYSIVGTYHISHGNMKEANKMFRKAIECDSTDYGSWVNLVISEYALEEYTDMTQHAIKALQYYPTQPLFYWFAGYGNVIADKKHDAITYLEKGMRYATDDKMLEDMETLLGDMYHATGENEKAYKAYEQVLLYNPDNAIVLNNYAYYLALDNKNLDKALAMAERANALSPNTSFMIDTQAWVLFMLGRYKEAESVMRKALENKNEITGSYYEHYGDILSKLGRHDEAISYWKKAKEKGGTTNEIEEKIKKGSL